MAGRAEGGGPGRQNRRRQDDKVGEGAVRRYPLRSQQNRSPDEPGEVHDDSLVERTDNVEAAVSRKATQKPFQTNQQRRESRISLNSFPEENNSPAISRSARRENVTERNRRNTSPPQVTPPSNVPRRSNEILRRRFSPLNATMREPIRNVESPRMNRAIEERLNEQERRVRQQAQQMRELDEICARVARINTEISAERIRHSERIAANEESV